MTRLARDLAAELHRSTVLEFCQSDLHDVIAGAVLDLIQAFGPEGDAFAAVLRDWALERGLDLASPSMDWERFLRPRRPSPPGTAADFPPPVKQR